MAKDSGAIDIINSEIWLKPFNGGRKQNIHPQVQSIDIYESLTNYTLQCDIHIADGIELFDRFPIAGEEEVEFSVQTPARKTCSYNFFVESITNLQTDENSMKKTYTLRCVTKDYLKNSFTLFTKRYKDKDYDVAVNECLMEDLGISKGVKIEKTKGKFDFAVNRVRPFQVMDLLCERAVSSKYKSSFFVFYEDNESYNFTTIEKLIVDRKGKANAYQFFYDTSNRSTDYDKTINVRNILSYEVLKQGSSIEKVRQGFMNQEVREFDIMHGDYFSKYSYVNISDFKQFEKTDSSNDLNSDKYSSYVSAKPAVSSMLFRDSTRPDMQHIANVPLKRGFQNKISEYGIRIRVYGDTNILVGDLVKVCIPEIAGITVPPEQAKKWSENYIVNQIRHRIQRTRGPDNRFESFMIMDLRKPNAFGAIA